MDRLKVSQTVLPSNLNRYILVSNLNIPTVYFGEANLTQRAVNFVNNEYSAGAENAAVDVYFELSAAYTLVHAESFARRVWVGSFGPRREFALTPIERFGDNFEATFRPFLNLRHLKQRLSDLVPDTLWSVESVESLIVNVQAEVALTHPTILRRRLLTVHHGRSGSSATVHRTVREYDLP